MLLALSTGMRRGEILGLRWSDVDLERGIAVLNKTKNRDRRAAQIIPSVKTLLDAHHDAKRPETDLVFAQPIEAKPVAIDHWFRLALKEARIDDFRFHDLRHTAASYLAMSGATTPEIAAVLGHRTLQMVKRYAHLSDAHTNAVVRRMNAKFFGGGLKDSDLGSAD